MSLQARESMTRSPKSINNRKFYVIVPHVLPKQKLCGKNSVYGIDTLKAVIDS
jgi:hypothetical protein